MRYQLRVFVDSDVIISSLISRSGAAYFLIHETDLKLYVSTFSFQELKIVVERLKLDTNEFEKLMKRKFSVIKLPKKARQIKKEYAEYVSEVNDAHVVAGTVMSQAQFLITYNMKHFKIEKIKSDFNILLTTPARFLQYLRSL